MKKVIAMMLMGPMLAMGADVNYTIRVPNLTVDSSKLECREITFGFNNELKTAAVNLPNKALSDSRVLLTSHTTNDAYWSLRLPEGSCAKIEELKKNPKLPASLVSKVGMFVETNGHVLLKGLHLMEHATLTIEAGTDPLVLSTERWTVAGGSQATVDEGK